MLSAVVLAKNEEKNIAACLSSLSFCDEIIVVDDESTDKTSALAQKSGATVFAHALEDDFAKQRNFGLEKTKGEWVLFVDADERVSISLQDEIKSEIRNPKSETSGYFVKRRDFMWGKELQYGESGNIKLLRLAKKNAGKWEGKVHEAWNVSGTIGQLENPLYHYPHPNVETFLTEINFYTDLRSTELFMSGIHVYFASIIFYPLGKFLQTYFLRFGFLDEIEGFLFAMLMSFHSFLVRAKLWLLWNKR